MMALKFFFTYFAKLKTVVFFAMHCIAVKNTFHMQKYL